VLKNTEHHGKGKTVENDEGKKQKTWWGGETLLAKKKKSAGRNTIEGMGKKSLHSKNG